MPRPQPSRWGSILLLKMSNTLKKPRRANLQFLFCRLIRADREWNPEQSCRKYLSPCPARKDFFALLLWQKRRITHRCPTSQNCHSRRLGDPWMILAELLQGRHSHGLRRNPWKMEAKENPVLLCSVAPSVLHRVVTARSLVPPLCVIPSLHPSLATQKSWQS